MLRKIILLNKILSSQQRKREKSDDRKKENELVLKTVKNNLHQNHFPFLLSQVVIPILN